MWQCGIKAHWCCAAGNSQRGPPKPEAADSSAPGEVYPQKWCTTRNIETCCYASVINAQTVGFCSDTTAGPTLWVNEQNMMYDRGGIKQEVLKRQPAAALCLAHYRTECRAFFMLLIYCSLHYFCFCWPALIGYCALFVEICTEPDVQRRAVSFLPGTPTTTLTRTGSDLYTCFISEHLFLSVFLFRIFYF